MKTSVTASGAPNDNLLQEEIRKEAISSQQDIDFQMEEEEQEFFDHILDEKDMEQTSLLDGVPMIDDFLMDTEDILNEDSRHCEFK